MDALEIVEVARVAARALAEVDLEIAMEEEADERAARTAFDPRVNDFSESELRWLAAFREQAK
jgi:hypothetical protein